MNSATLGVPTELASARIMAHAAVQVLYRAAVANVSPMPADEHTNLGWDIARKRFETHALGGSNLRAAVSLDPLILTLGDAVYPLEGRSPAQALAWLDEGLLSHGYEAASDIQLAYELPDEVFRIGTFAQIPGLAALAAWFELAQIVLQATAGHLSNVTPGPSPVRCWPHHFDLATYLSLETGHPETARGIGIGLSPGDNYYDQPYFYINPWPHFAPEHVPEAVHPGHWHVDDFVGLVATGTDILTLSDLLPETTGFIEKSVAVARAALKA